MKLVPALLIAAVMSATASAADQFVSQEVAAHYVHPAYTGVSFDSQVLAQTVGYSLHSDERGCSTCAPNCAAPATCCDSCAPSCAAPAACCNSCAPSCAAPASCCDSCAPSCAAPCAPSCAAPCDPCCECPPVCCPCPPKKKGFFSCIMDVERRKNAWLLGLIGR